MRKSESSSRWRRVLFQAYSEAVTVFAPQRLDQAIAVEVGCEFNLGHVAVSQKELQLLIKIADSFATDGFYQSIHHTFWLTACLFPTALE
jgi:hypothetical protein